MISSASDDVMHFWDLNTCTPFAQLHRPHAGDRSLLMLIHIHVWIQGTVRGLQFDSEKIITVGADKLIKIWKNNMRNSFKQYSQLQHCTKDEDASNEAVAIPPVEEIHSIATSVNVSGLQAIHTHVDH